MTLRPSFGHLSTRSTFPKAAIRAIPSAILKFLLDLREAFHADEDLLQAILELGEHRRDAESGVFPSVIRVGDDVLSVLVGLKPTSQSSPDILAPPLKISHSSPLALMFVMVGGGALVQFEYKAFVSYSWSDAKWAGWAHRAIESYRTPRSLVGQETALGRVPRSLHPLFKDREEEAAGASISAAVETALGGSEFLLVICSPRSAGSQWVNFEIAWFKVHRDPSKILALIVDGEPGASKMPGREDEECFPRALTHKVDANLNVTDVEEDTPLAADARPTGDGKREAKLKLVAAMLGVKLSDLVRRDEKRRALRNRILVTASLSIAAFTSAMAYFAIQARNEAQVQRDQAEGLVEYMISDLREKLQPKVQLDVLGGIADRANEYYAVQSNYTMDEDALGRRTRVLKLLGDLEQDRGNSERSLALYRQSVAASQRLLELDPDNPQRILEHAYSVQGLGNTAFAQGDMETALGQMSRAVELLGKLSRRDDASEEWTAEYGAALANLGIVQFRERELEPASRNLQQAVDIKREAAGRANVEWQDWLDFAFTLAWMAKNEAALGQNAKAARLRAEENAVYESMIADDPDDAYARAFQVVNTNNRADALLLEGNAEEARALALQSLNAAIDLIAIDAADTANVENLSNARLVLARAELVLGNVQRASVAARGANSGAEQLASADPSRIAWSGHLLGNVRVTAMRIAAIQANNPRSCRAALRPARAEVDRLAALLRDNPRDFNLALTHARAATLLGDYLILTGEPGAARRIWTDAETRLTRAGGSSGAPADLASRAISRELSSRIGADSAALSCGE